MQDSYTLYELNEYIRRVIALNFQEPLWISCEVAQCKESRGNFYLELVEQNENDETIAQASAAIWYKSALFLKNKLGDIFYSLMEPGCQVRIKVNVEFNERYGFKLLVEDIDPSYTMGKLELNRQKILERLKNEELLGLNQNIELPTVIQKIAVISADTAAGFADFKKHLQSNVYGYCFKITLFQSAMQGSNTEKEILQAFDEINASKEKFDIITIIRGGGSKLDLSAFDNFNIGARISKSNIPVITGIGHEIDITVADLCAHTQLKTPTAVANFIIDTCLHFESQILEFGTIIQQNIVQKIKYVTLSIEI